MSNAQNTTYRERRLARAEKLRGYAAANATTAAQAYEAAKQISDGIPFGQPILVGHHSEKGHRRDAARIDSGMRKSVEKTDRAEQQSATAAEIEYQAARAIYDDDPDAIERLTAKLAKLTEERDGIKAANAAARKAKQPAPYPAYALSNLGGVIGNTRKRIERLQRQATTGPTDRLILARFASECEDCSAPIEKGQLIRYNRQQGARCQTCEVAQ